MLVVCSAPCCVQCTVYCEVLLVACSVLCSVQCTTYCKVCLLVFYVTWFQRPGVGRAMGDQTFVIRTTTQRGIEEERQFLVCFN